MHLFNDLLENFLCLLFAIREIRTYTYAFGNYFVNLAY